MFKGTPASQLQSAAPALESDHVNGVSPLPKVCGQEKVIIANRIIGGKEAELGAFPWMARLRHMDDMGRKTYSCAGFLVMPKYVITAAHCVTSQGLAVLGPM